MTRLQICRWTALVGYFGLLFLLLNWLSWYSPPVEIPRTIVLMMVVAPLLLPLRGLLHATRRSHQWSTFLALPYFAMGVDYAFNSPNESGIGLLITLFSLMYWTGSTYYSKYSGPPRKKKTRTKKTSTQNT